jgi:phosphatidylserine/phosphatidylglycerophosphate/cardiolipin synthase-like enzyme
LKKVIRILLLFSLLSVFGVSSSLGLPAEDVQLITNNQYVPAAQKTIREAQKSIQVMMFEMVHYAGRSHSPSNLLIKELIEARKRGVKVEVILDMRKEEDRTAKQNRHTGKILSDGGVDVIYDPLDRTTHAKVIVADGELTLLGSTNWTYSALSNNNEASVLIRSKDVARELGAYFSRVKSTGTKK